MDTITTTNLRTQSSKLIETLKKGEKVTLIHRSRIVGVIKPKKEVKTMTKNDIEELKKLAEKINLPKTSYKERGRIYKEHLREKYGKNFS